MTFSLGGREEPSLAVQGPDRTDWLLPTAALSRFRLPEGAAVDRSRSLRQDVRYGFRVGSMNLLIRPRTVSEVMAIKPISAIPNSPPWLLGMINLRSNLVPVFDLALVCALERPIEDERRWILVFDKGDAAVGIIAEAQPEPLTQMTPLTHLPSLPTVLRGAVTGGFRVRQDLWFEFDHAVFFRSLSEGEGTRTR